MCKHEPVDDKETGQTYCKKCGKILLLCKRINGKPILVSLGGSWEGHTISPSIQVKTLPEKSAMEKAMMFEQSVLIGNEWHTATKILEQLKDEIRSMKMNPDDEWVRSKEQKARREAYNQAIDDIIRKIGGRK